MVSVEKYIKILNQIFPFSYLTKQEKLALLENSELLEYPKGETLFKAGEAENLSLLYLLVKGYVSVLLGEEVVGHIKAPSYFGERSGFFKQPRQATIIASTDISCIVIKDEIIYKLLQHNLNFCYAFATSLRNKHKIFDNYEEFVNLLKQRKISAKLRVLRLSEPYKALSPILHRHCRDKKIDFFALSYVLNKLPSQISLMNKLVLAPDLPEQFSKIQNEIKIDKKSRNKRNFYEVLPGRLFAILRDDMTDYIDIITKLCAYAIETKKIADRLVTKPSTIKLLADYYFGNATQRKKITEKKLPLPFTNTELKKLSAIYKDTLLDKLYEIAFQNGEIEVQTIFPKVRYYSDTSETWIAQINKLLNENLSYNSSDEIDVHIISSNTHSVLNCLSPWAHLNAKLLLKRVKNSCLENKADQLYASLRELIYSNPELIKSKRSLEKKYGIYHLDNPSLTGIDVNVIDLSKLSKNIDPSLIEYNQNQKKSILFNIDYAYGKQAETIIRSLILLFGKRIKSVSILGKTGSIIGERGELMIPDHFIIQENDVTYPINHSDINEKDFFNMGWQHKIHRGSMLTVLGTLMQNSEMLWFYRHFWNVIGMEMEGGYFLQEINRAKTQKLIDPNLLLRFAYYISDTPLNEGKTLANKLTVEEGLPAVYSITRVILKKILEKNNAK